jgi:hypothetical protein
MSTKHSDEEEEDRRGEGPPKEPNLDDLLRQLLDYADLPNPTGARAKGASGGGEPWDTGDWESELRSEHFGAIDQTTGRLNVAKLEREGALGKYKTAVFNGLVQGLTLILARLDYGNLQTVPKTVRAGVMVTILKTIPEIMPGKLAGTTQLLQEGLSTKTVQAAIQDWPLWLLAQVSEAIRLRTNAYIRGEEHLLADDEDRYRALDHATMVLGPAEIPPGFRRAEVPALAGVSSQRWYNIMRDLVESHVSHADASRVREEISLVEGTTDVNFSGFGRSDTAREKRRAELLQNEQSLWDSALGREREKNRISSTTIGGSGPGPMASAATVTKTPWGSGRSVPSNVHYQTNKTLFNASGDIARGKIITSSYGPPPGGHGMSSTLQLEGQAASKRGVYGSSFHEEVLSTYALEEQAKAGPLQGGMAGMLEAVAEASAIEEPDEMDTPEQAMRKMQAKISSLAKALSPENLRGLAAGGVYEGQDTGHEIEIPYEEVEPPILGTKSLERKIRSETLMAIGNKPFEGNGRDACTTTDYLTNLRHVIDGKLSSEAAFLLFRATTAGEAYNFIGEQIQMRAGIYFTWELFQRQFRDRYDPQRASMRLNELKHTRPKNLATAIQKVIKYNRHLAMHLPRAVRNAQMVFNTRADLTYIVRMHFASAAHIILTTEGRQSQQWCDERKAVRIRGHNPDEMTWTYHPINSLVGLMLTKAEIFHPMSLRDDRNDRKDGKRRTEVDMLSEASAPSRSTRRDQRGSSPTPSSGAGSLAPVSEFPDHDDRGSEASLPVGAEANNPVDAFETKDRQYKLMQGSGDPRPQQQKQTTPVICLNCLNLNHQWFECNLYEKAEPGTVRCRTCRGMHISKECKYKPRD